MHLHNPTFLIVCINVVIIFLLGFIGYVTHNPLVILGLLLLQAAPITDPSIFLTSGTAIEEEVEEIGGDAGQHRIGFAAKLR